MMDIGSFDGPVMVFGGPYSNFQATTALLDEARTRNIPATHIICTGDIVAYCGDAQETLDAIREAGIHVVMGNCEESLGEDKQDCGCGFEEGSACDLLSVKWFDHARNALNDSAKNWMHGLPRRLFFEMSGKGIAVIHGGAEEISRFIFRSTPSDDKRREISSLGVDGVIAGHCGLPFTENIDGQIWHNAGVIGMPANDATPRTWFSILMPRDGGIDFTHHALVYDHQMAARRMAEEKLPDAYGTCLVSGLWPNMDILPTAEQKQKGRALMPGHHFWI